MEETAQVARAYIEACGRKDEAALRALLDDAVEFRLGDGSTWDKAGWIAAQRRLGVVLARNDVELVTADGDRAVVVYDFVTDTAVGAVPSVEVVQVRDGRIVRGRLLFERLRWSEVLAELGRRLATP